MLTLDVLANTGRLRHRHAVEKVVPALVLLIITIARPAIPAAPLVLAATTFAAVAVGRIPLRRWLRALALPAGFIASGTIGIMLVSGDGPGPIPLTITEASAIEAGRVLLRSLAGTSAVVLIGVTTPMVDIIVLLRSLRVPAAVTDLMTSMYRLMFDLIATGRQLRTSQTARLGHVGLRRSVRSAGLGTTAVFIRSMHRAKRLQIGLDARGYDGELRVLSNERPLGMARLAIAVTVAIAILAVSLIWARSSVG